ncbi:AMP-dependent synthetase/ligase [Bryobacter aggregatus]|uniref:AMP-dependent synthetase/ligase n=1 Tax=Bryobacter aggregatus TaxID=360054 RepID=UPI0004E1D224|nr:long-chain fatty acid--CoA ligase [Bryobacter aggregatus]
MSSRTVFTALEEAAARYGDATALVQPEPGGKTTSYSWNQYMQIVKEVACGLRSLGIQYGDVVAIQSETRAEFYFADMGIICNGSIAAAMYTSYPQGEAIHKLRNCNAKLVFVENPKMLATLAASLSSAEPLDLQWVLMTGEAEGVQTLAGLRELGREAMAQDAQMFARIYIETKPQDPAIIYLTSGSTGEPKMGLVTHHAIVSNIAMAPKVLKLGPTDTAIAFLPSAHITQRLVLQMLPMEYGMSVYFSESLSRLPKEIAAVKPTFLLAPPRLWERIHTNIVTEMKKKPAAIQKLFHGGLGLGLKAMEYKSRGETVPFWISMPLSLVDRLVFSKIREKLGGRIRFAISGSAPLGKELAAFFGAVGVPILEGYGLTEGGVTHVNPLEKPKIGSIGPLLPGVKCKLMPDGEMALSGDTLFSGYYQDPEANKKVFTDDGWLLTGDIASVDPDGYWYITGRKKEILVASNGKKIYPNRIEGMFKGEPGISQVVLLGDKRPFVTALFTRNPAVTEPLEEKLKSLVQQVNKTVEAHEQIRKYKILPREFTIEQGEMTPTMKIRKSIVAEHFEAEINEMYAGKEEMQ